MTDKEKAAEVERLLKLTTTGYLKSNGQSKPAPWPDGSTYWKPAFDVLAQIGEEAPPPPTPPPGGFGYVYTLGSPTFDGDGFDGAAITQKGWVRVQPASALPTNRVYFDNSVQVMQSISAACHTVACELRGGDLKNPNDGSNAQRAHLASWDSQRAAYDSSQPPFSPVAGQEFWYGLAFDTNPGYIPQDDPGQGTWNIHVGFHDAIGGPQANLNLNIATIAPAGGVVGTEWRSGAALVPISPARFAVELNGGLISSAWPNENGTFTCRRYLGPVFTAGQLNRIQWRIKWGANSDGQVEVWINGTLVKNVSGISNMWRNASYAYDPGIYPVLENYRLVDTTIPQNIVYFGGIIRGTSRAQVTVP